MNGLLITDGINERFVISTRTFYLNAIKRFLKEVYDYKDEELKKVTFTYNHKSGTFEFGTHRGTYRIIEICTC